MATFKYKSTKTYEHSVGLSCCFRQHRAKSHCHYLHGYALQVKLVFAAEELDQNNWVVDFGGLKPIKKWLEETFDHKLLVAKDDPYLPFFIDLKEKGLADVLVVPHVGCEAFAAMIYERVANWLHIEYKNGVSRSFIVLESVEVREHGGNSAVYERID